VSSITGEGKAIAFAKRKNKEGRNRSKKKDRLAPRRNPLAVDCVEGKARPKEKRQQEGKGGGSLICYHRRVVRPGRIDNPIAANTTDMGGEGNFPESTKDWGSTSRWEGREKTHFGKEGLVLSKKVQLARGKPDCTEGKKASFRMGGKHSNKKRQKNTRNMAKRGLCHP